MRELTWETYTTFIRVHRFRRGFFGVDRKKWHPMRAFGSGYAFQRILGSLFQTIVQAHSILASTFAADLHSGRFILVLLRDPEPRLVYDRVESRRPVEMLLEMERPLLRPGEPDHAFTICEAVDGVVACRLDVSHTLIDAASAPIFVGALAKTSSGVELPPAPLFRDFVRYIRGTAGSEKLAYWSRYLQDLQPCECPINETPVTTDTYGLIDQRKV